MNNFYKKFLLGTLFVFIVLVVSVLPLTQNVFAKENSDCFVDTKDFPPEHVLIFDPREPLGKQSELSFLFVLGEGCVGKKIRFSVSVLDKENKEYPFRQTKYEKEFEVEKRRIDIVFKTHYVIPDTDFKYSYKILDEDGILLYEKLTDLLKCGSDKNLRCGGFPYWVIKTIKQLPTPEEIQTIEKGREAERVSEIEGDPCYDPDLIINDKKGNLKPGCYGLLEKIGDIKKIDVNQGIGFYINQIVIIIIGLAALVAVVVIVIAGVQYMTTEAVTQKGEAKKRIRNALIGILLILSVYVLLKTINVRLVNIDLDSKLNLEEKLITVNGVLVDKSTKRAVFVNKKLLEADTDWPFHYYKKSELKRIAPPDFPSSSKIFSVNNDECEKVGEPECTSLYFEKALAFRLVDALLNIKLASGKKLMITGGSEIWLHKSHGPDKPVLDLRPEEKLNKFLTGKTSFPEGCQKPIKLTQEASALINKAYVEGGPNSCPNSTGKHWHIIFK